MKVSRKFRNLSSDRRSMTALSFSSISIRGSAQLSLIDEKKTVDASDGHLAEEREDFRYLPPLRFLLHF